MSATLTDVQFLALHRLWLTAGPEPIVAALRIMNADPENFIPKDPGPRWSVGQTVVEVTKGSRHNDVAHDVVITKLGKVWAYYGDRGERFDMETGEIDGGEYSSPGYVYPSRPDYEEAKALEDAWDRLRSLTGYAGARRSPDLTSRDVLAFLALAENPDDDPEEA